MNYRRIVIFLTFMLGAAVYSGTLIRPGKSGGAAEQKIYAASDKREQKESRKIAVVNLDEGVSGNEGRVNYTEKLSGFPSMDFEYASLEAARTGIETGRYGAYVIIPADFSQNVESINTAPQVSSLEFAVNRSYSGKGQYELLCQVRSYMDSLNDNLSYMYVDNILREFHDAQDGAERVMENDLEDLAAIERIRSQDLVTPVLLPELPEEEMMPDPLDISGYMEQTSASAGELEAVYEKQIQDVQMQIASLGADGSALSERLKNLAGQETELDFMNDGNGGNITDKAEELLRAELGRQAELMPDREKIGGSLEMLKNRNEEFIRMYGEQDRSGDLFRDKEAAEPEEQEEWISFLSEQNREIELMLEEIRQAECLDMDRITELVRTEYVDPLTANVDKAEKEIQHRREEELAAVLEYSGQISGFHPQMDSLFLSQNIQGIRGNYRSMQVALLKNNHAYAEYAQKSAVSAKEYAQRLRNHAEEAGKASEEAVEEGLSAAKEAKEKNSVVNQRILRDFSSKLAYTRLGSAKYTRVYQFITNPLNMTDRSVNRPFDGYLSGRETGGSYF